ncbi:hypothetical protein BC830DRAFT_1233920 [Chytriomyces sp. MP71]|nr:hypothetical protein BC830DRAFT_1233920 [Chytriomyces sp. MP71]
MPAGIMGDKPVAMSLNPEDLEDGLDGDTLRARYEENMRAERVAARGEDFSDLVAEHASRQQKRRKKEEEKGGKRGKEEKFKDLKVWIVRDMYLKPLCELEFGWFFAGNCYVILNASTRPRGKTLYSDVFAWIGSKAMDSDIGFALHKASEIRSYVGLKNCAVHKESQDCETSLLLENFKYLRYTYGERFHIPGHPSRKKVTEMHTTEPHLVTLRRRNKAFKYQEATSTPLLANVYIPQHLGQRSSRFSRLIQQQQQLASDKSVPKLTSLFDIVIQASKKSVQDANRVLTQQKLQLDQATLRAANLLSKSNGDSQHPLLYPASGSVAPYTFFQPAHVILPAGGRPHLFRIHAARKVRPEALGSRCVVIEEIRLSRDFVSAVEPDPEADEEDEEEGKPPTATRLPEGTGRVLPTGYRIWDKRFEPSEEGVYVLEGTGFLWVFGAGVKAAGVGSHERFPVLSVPAKVDTGLAPQGRLSLGSVGNSVRRSTMDVTGAGLVGDSAFSTGGQLGSNTIVAVIGDRSDADIERTSAIEWAREVAQVRGHGKLECIDESDIIINKLWISLGVKTKSLRNELTVSERALNEWERDKEDEAQEDSQEEDQVTLTAQKQKAADLILKYRDPVPYFSRIKLQARHEPVLYRTISGSPINALEYEEVERGVIKKADLTNDHIFFLDIGNRVFVWVGRLCEGWEQEDCLLIGQEFLIKHRMPLNTPITGLVEKGENELFVGCFGTDEDQQPSK